MSYLLLIAVMFSAGGRLTVELELDTHADCAAAFDEARQAAESIGPVRAMVGECRAVA